MVVADVNQQANMFVVGGVVVVALLNVGKFPLKERMINCFLDIGTFS